MQRVIDPTNGRLLREVPYADPAQVEAALAASHACFQDWRRASFADMGQSIARHLGIGPLNAGDDCFGHARAA